MDNLDKVDSTMFAMINLPVKRGSKFEDFIDSISVVRDSTEYTTFDGWVGYIGDKYETITITFKNGWEAIFERNVHTNFVTLVEFTINVKGTTY